MADRIDISKLKEAALGRWPDILQAAGIGAEYLTRKHTACPVCGGRDRFRFTDKDDRGCFICNTHAPEGGDGFKLLADYRQTDFIGAARFVVDCLGGAAVVAVAPDAAAIAERQAREQAEQRRAWEKAKAENLALWNSSHPITNGCTVGLYLRHRGLELAGYPKALRFNPSIPYWDKPNGHLVKLGDFPAMVAAVQAPNGTTIALHKTYLQANGHKAKVPSAKKWSAKSGDAKGAAIRLFPAAECMAVAEGIETALAVHCANGLPVWAGVSAFGVGSLVLPDLVRDVVIFADNDENQTGQKAANQLADNLLAEGKTVRVLFPSVPGRDWLDVLTQGAQR
ncbi:toprim domain-containing protein [Chitinibacter bivalviorum]|uniref:Toprim domain-containing protein n=1 Tax=Chitinibacter bivalviorum TaxID=2739434 RepID=A0A7H9BEB1_9NEIS|nr:toprim domain-containing protein [Chitinibacter bivalviorum]QLG87063.1 toprim domain-containing protein [Chitinibacter bivalviorum]